MECRTNKSVATSFANSGAHQRKPLRFIIKEQKKKNTEMSYAATIEKLAVWCNIIQPVRHFVYIHAFVEEEDKACTYVNLLLSN